MLQLQQRTLCQRQSYVPAAPVSVASYKVAATPKHVPQRISRCALLTVHSGRGEEVVAFLPDDGSERTYASTGQAVKICTMDGRKYSLPITQGITSMADIRAFVAHKENSPTEQVRLAYAGRELDPAKDFEVFVPVPGMDVMHAMHRMSGGGAAGGF